MKKIQTYILYGIILLGCFSCKKEDNLIPNAPQPNLFAPAEGATDPTSQLRRKFYEETGAYLLFTDTLKNEYYGTDVYGNPLYTTELLDLSYGINSSALWKFEFEYLSDYEKQQSAVELLKKQILPVLPKNYYPYSFLLIDNLIAYTWWSEEGATDGWWDSGYEQDFYFGTRAMAINISMLENEGEAFAKRILNRLIRDYYLTAEKLQEFYAPGRNYYGKYIYDYEYGFWSEEDFIQATGILAYYYDGWEYFEVYGSESDLVKYLEFILDGSEEDFKAEYADYPLVLKKYDMLKQLLIEGGFAV
ncbi:MULTISPECIES: hypothetical protein [Butyricimonas]|uniref:hypothetical protein n=1 Tax=Butyricimonas TaxID=574697 RepID=UPI0007FB3F36|nr:MULTISPECIES: hypothetical protein [Butyricimonas]